MAISTKQAIEEAGWLGFIRKIHSIGPYDLVEYEQKEITNSDTNGETFYTVFVDGQRTSTSFRNIDEALIFGISKRNLDEPNTARWYAQAATKILIGEPNA